MSLTPDDKQKLVSDFVDEIGSVLAEKEYNYGQLVYGLSTLLAITFDQKNDNAMEFCNHISDYIKRTIIIIGNNDAKSVLPD